MSKPPFIPKQLDIEISLAAIASTTKRIADSLEELVQASNRFADDTLPVTLERLEDELRRFEDLPETSDAINSIANSFLYIVRETKRRIGL